VSAIYRHALGDAFDRLHPRLQRRFGISSLGATCQIGRGMMDEVWRGPWWTVPILRLGMTQRILFPEHGRDIPFAITNHAYLDRFGREAVGWCRRFRFGARRRAFDAAMVYSKERGTIVDYLGTHHHLAVDIGCSVDDEGAMRIRTGDQRVYLGPLAVPLPRSLTVVADVREWWDDEAERFRIEVRVTNPLIGALFGYRGSFTVTEHPCTAADIPADLRPRREEIRE
jgi:hypothetical protein